MNTKLLLTGAGLAALGAGAVLADRLAQRALARFETLDADTAELPGQRFWVRGVALHFEEQGEGFPVLLIPGFLGSTFSFRHTMPALAAQFRVLAVDLPGFGYSDRGAQIEYSASNWVSLLAEFLGRQGIERAVVLGHSLGGGVAQRLALEHPELVERLVLVSSTSAAEPPRLPPRGSRRLYRLGQAWVMPRHGAMRWFAQRSAFDPAFITDDVVEGYARSSRLPGSAAAVRKVLRDAAKDARLDLSQIAAPALLLWGEGDRVVDLKVGRRLAEQLPHARLEVVEQAGHLPLEEQPEACNRLLLDFLHDLGRAPAQAQASLSGGARRNGAE
ncbi:MAG TPA: alpha/beta hydrolase [Dehalococcoidia bacterium]|nr:alpha/beta hydrolase [Dehalococcoidia bacterium]